MPVAYSVPIVSWKQKAYRFLVQGTALRRLSRQMASVTPVVTPPPPPPVALPPSLPVLPPPGSQARAALYACDPPFDLRSPEARSDALHLINRDDLWADREMPALPVLAQSLVRRLSLLGALREHQMPDTAFFDRLRRDTAYLRHYYNSDAAAEYKVMCAAAALTAQVCFNLAAEAVDRETSILYRLLRESFNKSGAHVSRNFSVQLYTLEALVALRDVLAKRGLPIDNILREVLINAAEHLRAFRCHDGGLPMFNGSFAESPVYIDRILDSVPVRNEMPMTDDGGYVLLRAKRTSVVADFGRAPESRYARQAGAGLFAFELCSGMQRIIVNCGNGLTAGDPWVQALRCSDAHSGLTPDGCNSGTFDAGNAALHTPPQLHRKVLKTARGPVAEGSHNGWAAGHGLLYRRRLVLHQDGTVLQGEDWLTPIGSPRERQKRVGSTFAVRFHLHPDVRPELIKSGGAMLRLPDDRTWVLTPGARPLRIEDSVYVQPDGRISKSKQLVLTGNINRDETKIRWVLQGMRQNAVKRDQAEAGVEIGAGAEINAAATTEVSEDA